MYASLRDLRPSIVDVYAILALGVFNARDWPSFATGKAVDFR
jgi:hypothetical protein